MTLLLRLLTTYYLIATVALASKNVQRNIQGGINRDTVFYCTSTNPTSWTFDGSNGHQITDVNNIQNVHSNADSLNFDGVVPSNEGVYRCFYGSDQDIFNLSVVAVPHFTGCQPASSCNLQEIVEGVQGQTISMNMSLQFVNGGTRGLNQSIQFLRFKDSTSFPVINCFNTESCATSNPRISYDRSPYNPWDISFNISNATLEDSNTYYIEAALIDPVNTASIQTITSTVSINITATPPPVQQTSTQLPLITSTTSIVNYITTSTLIDSTTTNPSTTTTTTTTTILPPPVITSTTATSTATTTTSVPSTTTTTTTSISSTPFPSHSSSFLSSNNLLTTSQLVVSTIHVPPTSEPSSENPESATLPLAITLAIVAVLIIVIAILLVIASIYVMHRFCKKQHPLEVCTTTVTKLTTKNKTETDGSGPIYASIQNSTSTRISYISTHTEQIYDFTQNVQFTLSEDKNSSPITV